MGRLPKKKTKKKKVTRKATTKAVARRTTRTNKAVATMPVNTKKASLENISSEDITLPRIKMIQAMSDEVNLGAKPGEFFNKVTQEVDKLIDIVPVYLFKQRVLFDDSMQLACMSNNALKCTQGLHLGRNCQECPLSQWTEDKKTGDKKPPECILTNNFLVYLPEDIKKIAKGGFCFPKVMSFGKSSFQCSKDIISTALYQGGELFDFQIELKSIKRQKDKYTFFVPVQTGYKQVDTKVVQIISKMLPGLKQLVGKIDIAKSDVDDTDDIK